MTSIPSARQPAISPSRQSSARGRGMIAKRPLVGGLALKPRPRYESRVWTSMIDDDKRAVHVIERQPIGGLKFFRHSNYDFKPAH